MKSYGQLLDSIKALPEEEQESLVDIVRKRLAERRRAARVGSARNGHKGLQDRKITSLPDFAARRKAIFSKPIPASQVRLVDKLLAGE